MIRRGKRPLFATLIVVIILCLINFDLNIYMKIRSNREASIKVPKSQRKISPHRRQKRGSLLPRSCRHPFIGLPHLINKLKEDPDSTGLQTLVVNRTKDVGRVNDTNMITQSIKKKYRGLDTELLSKSFRGRRIAIIGDSTLFYFTKYLDVILRSNDKEEAETFNTKNNETIVNQNNNFNGTNISIIGSNYDFSRLSLSKGNFLVEEKGLKYCDPPVNLKDGKELPQPIVNETDGTVIQWIGYRGRVRRFTPEIIEDIWSKVNEIQPEIMIVNMGLHWLHFMGQGREVAGGHAVHRWLHYESWLQEVLDNALQMKNGATKLLLYKTTNFMCEKKYYGTYVQADQLYQSQHVGVLRRCRKRIMHDYSDGHNITKDQAELYCSNGTFNEVGANYLNQRMFQFVEKIPPSISDTLQVGIFNDHDVQSNACELSLDGRHYHDLNLLRIRLLGNIIRHWEYHNCSESN